MTRRSGFDGFGIGGALEKQNLGTIVGWVCEELPEDRPRHLLGISEPDDMFTAIENGADTFDCVSPSRVARNGSIYSARGRIQHHQRPVPRDFGPLDDDCDCYTCAHYTRAYVHHLFRAKEMLSATLCDHPQRAVRASGWSTGSGAASTTGRSRSSAPSSWAILRGGGTRRALKTCSAPPTQATGSPGRAGSACSVAPRRPGQSARGTRPW